MSSAKGTGGSAKGTAKGARGDGTEVSGGGDVHRSLELLWGTGERGTRGPKPGLTLDRIVGEAVRLADAEGLAAVSMRRLATELGTGTMSLYRYVPGKTELLALMLDRVQGESLEGHTFEEAAAQTWREAIESMAREHLAQYRRHPWLLRVNQARTALGPNAIRSLEYAIAPLRGTGLSDPEMISTILMVQGFATGVARMEIEAVEVVRETGLSDEEFWKSQEPFLDRAMRSGEFPLVAALSEETFGEEFDHFAFGLQRLIDGLEVRIAARAEKG